MLRRDDDYAARRAHLAGLSDEALKERFWQLADQLVSPLIDNAREYTSPAIERSVLLRMGFSSLEAKALVELCLKNDLLSHGAGQVVMKVAGQQGLPYREAGLKLIADEGWEEAKSLFTAPVGGQ